MREAEAKGTADRAARLLQTTAGRYLIGLAAVTLAFLARTLMSPLTGTGAPFVLFFGAMLATSLLAGVGPGLAVLLVSLPLAAYLFVFRAGFSLSQATFQALLYAIDGLMIVFLTSRVNKARQAVQRVNHQLHRSNEELTRTMEARERTNTLLRESEEQFRLTLDEAPIGMALVALDGRFVRVNRALCEIVGYTSGELVGLTFQAITHPDDLDADVTAAGRLARGEIPRYQFGKRYIRKDGTIVDVLLSVSVLRDQRGSPLYFIFQIEDVSERKQAEEALRVSEAKFAGIVSIAADAIVSVDEDQRIVIFNEGAEKIFGYSKREMVGALLDVLIPERLRAVHRQHVAAFAMNRETARQMGNRADVLGVRKNGEEFPAEASISKLVAGNKTLLTVALRDISERKRVEKEQHFLAETTAVLSESLDYEQTLATFARLIVREFADWCVVEIMEEGEQLRRLKVVSADPTKTALCSALEQMPLDRARPHLISPVLDTKRPLLIEDLTSQQLESLAQGPEHLHVLRALRPKSLMTIPLLRHEQLFGALAFISSTRAYTPADVRLGEALADRAAVAIEHARLYRASREAIQLRERVLGIVAHDLRNPLAAIRIQASLLKRRAPESERRSQKPVDSINNVAIRMDRLIQDLLSAALIDVGELTIQPTRLSTSQLMTEVVDMERPVASSSSVELQLDVEPELRDIRADHDRLLQVFENLIGNAIKFTSPGGRITVGAESREDEVLFRVADTGCGISPGDVAHIFDQFWRATERTGGVGAGLGLYITKGLVEAHGGRIWVESTPARGSTFFFSIPTLDGQTRTNG